MISDGVSIFNVTSFTFLSCRKLQSCRACSLLLLRFCYLRLVTSICVGKFLRYCCAVSWKTFSVRLERVLQKSVFQKTQLFAKFVQCSEGYFDGVLRSHCQQCGMMVHRAMIYDLILLYLMTKRMPDLERGLDTGTEKSDFSVTVSLFRSERRRCNLT